MASTPTYNPALKLSLAVLLPLLLAEEVIRVTASSSSYGGGGGGPPSETTDNIQSRIIPPFSPSLELARSMGSSPVTPQGSDGVGGVGGGPLESPRGDIFDSSYSSYLGEQHRQQQLQLQQLEAPDGLAEGIARGVAIPDAAYPPDLISEKGPRWREDDIVPPLGGLSLRDEEEEDDDEEEDEEEDDDGEGCPPRLVEGFITWRRNNRVARAILPHVVPSPCTPPLRCSVSTTVFRRVFLQEGDTLEVILQAPPDYTPPTQPPSSSTTAPVPSSPSAPTPLDSLTEMYPDEDVTDLSTPTLGQYQLQQQHQQQQQRDELGQEEQQHQGQQQQQQEQRKTQSRGSEVMLQHEEHPEQVNDPRGSGDELSPSEEHLIQEQLQNFEPRAELTTWKAQQYQNPPLDGSQRQNPRREQENPAVPTMSPSMPPPPPPPSLSEPLDGSLQDPLERRRMPSMASTPKHAVPSAYANKNKTHLFSRDDHHIPSAHSTFPPSPTRKKRQVSGPPEGGLQHAPLILMKHPAILDAVGDVAKKRKEAKEKQITTMLMTRAAKEEEEEEEEEEKEEHEEEREREKQMVASPLTVWRASVAEWSSCSTREGGQIGDTSPEGIVTISPRFLQVGTNYFIGRPSWSSHECYLIQVTVRSAECGEGSLCSGKGSCYANTTMEHFQCKCCSAYMGTHCEEMNACVSSPCLNFGICVDIQEGHDGDTFQCLCRYGYGGRYCEERTNLCESGPCKNGATCTGNHSAYTCRCTPGWSGQQCMERVETTALVTRPGEGPNEVAKCSLNPCNNGICVETRSQDVRCFCHPGFGGLRCEFEYNECESSPCENGGTCVDHVGKYECLCGRGYAGDRCQVKYDLCSPDPCEKNKVCIDKGNSHSCECINGLSEDDCGPHIQVCTPNPCENGGTCWIVPQAHVFYCSCRPGFTGSTCQGITLESHDEAVPETVGAVGTVEPGPLEVHLPLNHMRNIYVAFATLASALLIFALVVGVCHCRVNRTYRKCFVKLPRPSKVLPSVRRPRPTSLFDKSRWERSGSLRLEMDPDGAAMPMTSSNSNSDAVYYNMDVCDNQELPLIK